MGLGQRTGEGCGRVGHVVCVELLHPPTAGPGDGPGLTIGCEGQHLGADQLDLLAAAVLLRPHPQVALGRHWAQQVDDDSAEPGVVTLLAALERANQQR